MLNHKNIMKYILLLLTLSFLPATVTNTATLTISDATVTINGVFNNYGSVLNNGELFVFGSYMDYGQGVVTGDGEFVIYADEFSNADLNEDGLINVLDVVLIMNLVLEDEYSELGDVNSDGELNILDMVIVINIILYTL